MRSFPLGFHKDLFLNDVCFCYCLLHDGSFFRWCHSTMLCESVCLSATLVLGFHPIKSWLKRWQTWHTLFIILMTRVSLSLSLSGALKASRSSHYLQTHETVWRSWTYSMHYQINMVHVNDLNDTENYFSQRETWLILVHCILHTS